MNLLARFIDPIKWIKSESAASRALIRFIAVFPYLENANTAASIFRETLKPFKKELPKFFGAFFVISRLTPKIFVFLMRIGIRLFANRFIAGNGTKEITKTIKNYSERGYLVNIDILGEAVLSEKEAENYKNLYLRLINELGPQLPSGALSISLKSSAFYSQAFSSAPEHASDKIVERMTPIFKALKRFNGHAFLDAEEYSFRQVHLLIFQKLYKQFGGMVRFVIQGYLKTSFRMIWELYNINRATDPIHIRLVRGAYWDHECYRAEILGWDESPVFTEKEDTDKNYEYVLSEGIAMGFKMIPGTHNIESVLVAEKIGAEFNQPITEYQFLYGIGEPYAKELLRKNIPVRFYMPVLYPKGNLTEAMAYLARRINESQVSFVMRGNDKDQERRLYERIQKRTAY